MIPRLKEASPCVDLRFVCVEEFSVVLPSCASLDDPAGLAQSSSVSI